MIASLERDLREIVGDDHLLTDPALTAVYAVDWTGRFRGRALAVVRPADAAEVLAALAACRRQRVPVVPQGGNTGLVAGAVPEDAVVLSTTRLSDLGPVDSAARAVTVGAGAALARVQAHTAPHGLAPGVDLAARGSATIGGMVATNAGGVHALRHGAMREQVISLQVALPNGRFVEDEGGTVFSGSEGTLGIITSVRLRLVPIWSYRATALLGFGGLDDALRAVRGVRSATRDLDAVEYLDAASLELGVRRSGSAMPFEQTPPTTLLVETAGERPGLDALAAAIADLPHATEPILTDAPPVRRRLWDLRESLTEGIASEGVAHKLDVRLPAGSLASFVDELARLVRRTDPQARVFVFGHLAVGGLHVNVVGPAADDERVDDAVMELVLTHHGSIAAEHGYGRLKSRWLDRDRSPDERAAMLERKHAFDPDGLLNPRVLDPGS